MKMTTDRMLPQMADQNEAPSNKLMITPSTVMPVEISPRYQYFSDGRLGGRSYMEYCPYVEPEEACEGSAECLAIGTVRECHACDALGGAVVLDGRLVLNCSAERLCPVDTPENLRGVLCDRNRMCTLGGIDRLCASSAWTRASNAAGAGRRPGLALVLLLAAVPLLVAEIL